MGREVVFANIRKRMIAMIVGGVILTLMGGFISFAAVVAGEYSVLILGLFALTPGVIFLIFGTSRRTHPEKSGIFKANPDLLPQADELYANIQYQDDHIIVSDRVLANKKVPFQMCWREEAYGIYQHTASMNFISYTNEIRSTRRMYCVLTYMPRARTPPWGLCNCFPNVVPTQW